MGHRLIALCVLGLTACSGPRTVPDQASTYRHAGVRAEGMAFYTGRAIPDSALYGLPMIAEPPAAPPQQRRVAPLYVHESVTAVMVTGATLGDVVQMWARVWGYSPTFTHDSARNLRLLSTWRGQADAGVLSDWLFDQTGQRVTVFPESRLLMVTGG